MTKELQEALKNSKHKRGNPSMLLSNLNSIYNEQKEETERLGEPLSSLLLNSPKSFQEELRYLIKCSPKHMFKKLNKKKYELISTFFGNKIPYNDCIRLSSIIGFEGTQEQKYNEILSTFVPIINKMSKNAIEQLETNYIMIKHNKDITKIYTSY